MQNTLDTAFSVDQVHADGEAGNQAGGQVFGTVDRAVLPPGAAEGYLQMRETPLQETRYMGVYQCIGIIQETEDFPVFFQEADYGFVQTGKFLVLSVFSGVMGTAAVEDIASSVSRGVFRNALLERKTVHRNREPPFLRGRGF